jgi:hypothetical protein
MVRQHLSDYFGPAIAGDYALVARISKMGLHVLGNDQLFTLLAVNFPHLALLIPKGSIEVSLEFVSEKAAVTAGLASDEPLGAFLFVVLLYLSDLEFYAAPQGASHQGERTSRLLVHLEIRQWEAETAASTEDVAERAVMLHVIHEVLVCHFLLTAVRADDFAFWALLSFVLNAPPLKDTLAAAQPAENSPILALAIHMPLHARLRNKSAAPIFIIHDHEIELTKAAPAESVGKLYPEPPVSLTVVHNLASFEQARLFIADANPPSNVIQPAPLHSLRALAHLNLLILWPLVRQDLVEVE